MDTGPIKNNTSIAGLNSPDNIQGPIAPKKARKPVADADGTASKQARSDFQIGISPEAKTKAEAMRRATEIARATPDVREERVAELKKKIQEGTYQVDAGKVADGVMREAILERLSRGDGPQREV